MTEKFEFEAPQVRLTLCGREYPVTADDNTAATCCDILAEAKARLKSLKCGDCNEQLSEVGICRFLKESVERLIGCGTVDEIFGERCQNISDMAELMCYIVSKIRTAYQSKTE